MNNPSSTQLGKLLRKLRTEAGLTMYELAKRTGINRSTLMRIEEGSTTSPDTGTLNALARGLEVEAELLYDAAWQGTETPLPSPAVYFRSKFRLNAEQIAKLEASLRRVKNKPTKGTEPHKPNNDNS